MGTEQTTETTVVRVGDMPVATLKALAPFAREAQQDAGGTGSDSYAATLRWAAAAILCRLQADAVVQDVCSGEPKC